MFCFLEYLFFMKLVQTILIFLISLNTLSQQIKTNNKLTIYHDDITLYLTNDTCPLISKHTISYSNFLKLDKDRDDNWFEDTYKGKYKKDHYYKSGYDIGHLTPSHITSYNDTINHTSFSLFNAAPQKPSFNRGSWKSLESSVEDTIKKYKSDAIIITGVIYDSITKKYLPNSKIPIPLYYFKIVYINKKTFVWLGSNIDSTIKPSTLNEINKLLKKQKVKIN